MTAFGIYRDAPPAGEKDDVEGDFSLPVRFRFIAESMHNLA